MSEDGSFVLFSGVAAAKIAVGTLGVAITNGAAGVLARSLALELAAIRVNAISLPQRERHRRQGRPWRAGQGGLLRRHQHPQSRPAHRDRRRHRAGAAAEPRASMRACSYHASPRPGQGNALWIGLWMVYVNTLVNFSTAVDECCCGKVDNRCETGSCQVAGLPCGTGRYGVSTGEPATPLSLQARPPSACRLDEPRTRAGKRRPPLAGILRNAQRGLINHGFAGMLRYSSGLD